MSASLLIRNISELASPTSDHGFLKVQNAAIVIEDCRIAWAGPAAQLPSSAAALPVFDAGGHAVVPGFVDSHTHFIFAGYREDEFLWRAQGLPYMEIHKRGGGIARTVSATRAASLEELRALGAARLKTMLSMGVTTVEGKSGYGLDLDTELSMLEAMQQLSQSQPVSIVTTYLGPHSIPPEFAGKPGAYIDYVIGRVLPVVAERRLARFADIFCERGIFELDDSRRYLLAARKLGFGLKIHADEIEALGGAGLAAEVGAASADHLLKASPKDIEAMARAGVTAGVLPLTAFTLREPYAPARAMLDAGCTVALASDLNPGSCYSNSIPLIFALAVLYMNLKPEEALTGLTLSGAKSIGLEERIGSIEKGKDADLVVLDAPSFNFLPYNVGMNLALSVFKRGIKVL